MVVGTVHSTKQICSKQPGHAVQLKLEARTYFCKSKSISRNSLNMGLNSVGIKIACKTRTNRNNWEQKREKIK
jgi:hypothetical protein